MTRFVRNMLVLLLAVVFLGTGLIPGTAVASDDKQAIPKAPNKQQLTDAQVKQLLLLMDTDKNGKISKQEWTNFMTAEFDRLDKDKSGELDPQELAASKVQASTFPKAAGK